jgi:WD repeat-containing protein 35
MTTLEHYEEFTAERRAKFEDLAIDIFVKNPPSDPPRVVAGVTCTKCGASVSALQSQCSECGHKLKVCVSTGKPIVEDSCWECQICKHCVLVDLAEELVVCPMCHHPISA